MDISKKIYLLKEGNKRFLVATLVEISGSSPGKTGFKMIVQEDGKTFGTVGGGNLEMLVKKDGLKMLKHSKNGLKTYDLSKNSKKQKGKIETGMICGGIAKIYFESVIPKFYVYIFGGGHIAQAIGKILDRQKYKIIVIDNRKEFIKKEFHPKAEERIFADYTEFTEKFAPSQNSFVIIVTHTHKHDYEILKNIYKRKLNLKYVGMIGSKTKVTANLKKLKSEISDLNLKNLYAPIGLKIGGDSPHEIAISIIAEIQSVIYDKNNHHMKSDYEKI